MDVDGGRVRRERVERRAGRVDVAAAADDECRARVAAHQRQAVRWIRGIEREVRGAGLQHAERADHALDAPGCEHGDDGLGSRAELDQPVGDLVGARRELRVGHFAIAGDDRDGRRRGGRVLVHGRVQEVRGGSRHGRPGGGRHERGPVGGVEQVELAERGIGSLGGGPAQPLEVGQEAPRRGGVEQRGRVLEGDDGPAVIFRHRQGQLETRTPGVERNRFEVAAAEPAGRVRLGLERERHLEDRMVRQVAAGHHAVNDRLERRRLVGGRVEHRGAHAADERGERWVACRVDPHGQRVDEEPDHCVELGGGAAGHRAPDDDVVDSRVPGEERVERGEDDHEERGVVGGRDRAEGVGDRAVEAGVDARASMRLHRRVRAVGW